jgi:calcineurin-like phosphoesterase family protein
MQLIIDRPQGVFFTSDHHFGHRNIIRHCGRPFADVEAMDETMVKNWNDRVGANDTVFHLGDLTLNGDASSYLSRLKGRIQVLALEWHHDKEWLKKAKRGSPLLSASGHEVVLLPGLVVLKVNAFKLGSHALPITLSHYPLAEWEASHHGAWHLHGHSHGNYRDPKGRACVDVGVDAQEFRPVGLMELYQRLGVEPRGEGKTRRNTGEKLEGPDETGLENPL